MFRLAMIVLITAVSCGTGFAQGNPVYSANDYMPACREFVSDSGGAKQQYPFDRGWCGGFIAGIVFADVVNRMICIPNGATYGQYVRVVVQYIDQRPARMHETFGKLATEALRSAWPCKTGQ